MAPYDDAVLEDTGEGMATMTLPLTTPQHPMMAPPYSMTEHRDAVDSVVDLEFPMAESWCVLLPPDVAVIHHHVFWPHTARDIADHVDGELCARRWGVADLAQAIHADGTVVRGIVESGHGPSVVIEAICQELHIPLAYLPDDIDDGGW